MRYLEVRRHTMRNAPEPHLTQAGVTLARRVGEGMGPFARVVTTLAPRAFETAIAMGFAVDEQPDRSPSMGDDVDAEINWSVGFQGWAEAAKRGGAAGRFAHEEAAFWRGIVESVPDGASALLISHGGIIEAGVVACLPGADHATMGEYCSYCEGARLAYEGGKWVGVEVLRVVE